MPNLSHTFTDTCDILSPYMKKTKIVATIGPASQNEKILKELFKAGVNVTRLNFSHGNLEQKKEAIALIRSVAAKTHHEIAILADLPGPKLRLGEIDGTFQIKKGMTLTFGLDSKATLPIQYDFTKAVKADHRMYLNDGLIQLKIISTKGGIVTAKALNSGWVTSRKGINLPDTTLPGAAFTPEDKKAAEFAIEQNVEFIALSFVQSAEDIHMLRAVLKQKKSRTHIIAKIEKPQAVENIEKIMEATDGVMVARGDLAIETSPAQVPLIQQKIILLARQQQKPVIVATQMLESMIENPRPTRAEASDVANAVLSQVDAVMLSAESASGKYPVEAVSTMSEIIEAVEADAEFRRYIKINWEKLNLEDIHFNAIAASSASLAYRLKAPIIGIGTVTGRTAQLLSSFRPNSIIAAMTHDEFIGRQLVLNWGVYPIIVTEDAQDHHFGETMLAALRLKKWAPKGQTAVLIWGSKIGISGTTNTIRALVL